MDCYVFPYGLAGLLDQSIQWIDHSISCIALENDATPSTATDRWVSDIGSTEVGRSTLTGKTVTLATSNIFFDAANPSFSAATSEDLRHFIIAKDTGSDSTSPIIFWLDYGSAATVYGEQITVIFPDDGIYSIGCSANIFPSGLKDILDHSIDWFSDSIKCALYDSSTGTPPNAATHVYLSDLTCTEVVGATRLDVSGIVGTVRSGQAALYASDLEFDNVISTDLQYAVIYCHAGTDGQNKIIYATDNGVALSSYNQSVRFELTEDFIRGI